MIERTVPAAHFLAFISIWIFSMGAAVEVTAQEPDAARSSRTITFETDEAGKAVNVLIDAEPFTTFNYGGETKPFLHPVFGPGGLRMTRDFPIKQTGGEADDHPHHQSIWVGHEINGIDFWSNKGGIIRVSETPAIDRKAGTLTANSEWISHEGETVCRDETVWAFGAGQESRWIDCQFKLVASEKAIEISDTKEGTVAIRTHPSLRLKPDARRGVKKVFGEAFNATGTSGPSIWGQTSAWVAYTGKIEGKPASIVLLDHPQNFRHPTTWHARDYGLVAANPFGLTAFQNTKKNAGAVTLVKGQQITLRYRFEFFGSIVNAEDCRKAFKDFAGAKP